MTDRQIDSLKPSANRQTIHDDKVVGLRLRITPRGKKSWSFFYRNTLDNQRLITLGSYPAVSLSQAREQAKKLKAAVEVEKRDPYAEAKAARAAALTPTKSEFTFADMVKIYLPFAKSTKKTWRDDESKINQRLLPRWGERPLRSITRSDVHDLLDELIAEGMGGGVNRYQALVSRIFTIALDRGKVEAHPVTRMIKRAKEAARERALSDEEIRELSASLDGNDTPAADVVRLRLLTGQRGDEVVEMRRREVDLIRATWTIPGTSAKNGHAHVVPLSPTAHAILSRRIATASADQNMLFAGVNLWGHDLRKLGEIARKAGYQWRDLRRTVATRLAEMGVPEETIGRVLNHARHTVTAKHYNQHQYTNEKRAALDKWDAELRRIIENKPNAASVVSAFKATA